MSHFKWNILTFTILLEILKVRTSIIFWSKIRTLLIDVLNDTPHSCNHFHTKSLVVGSHLRRRKGKKQLKMAINYNTFLTTSYESAL